jgi:MFS family permease
MEDENAKTSGLTSFRSMFANLSVFQFLTFLRRGVFYTFMINYLFTLGQTVTFTAFLGTFNMVASSLGQNLLWGRICDRVKVRAKLIIAGETIAAFSYIIVFLIHKSLINAESSFVAGLAIISGLSILEFFWSMSDVGWAALLTDITTVKTRGRVIGALNFIASLGRMVGILFAGFLYENGEGFRNGTIFYIVTALLIVGISIMLFLLRHVRWRSTTSCEAASEVKESEGKSAEQNEKTYKWFLASLVIIVLGVASVNQIFMLFIKLPSGLNVSDYEMSLILSAWTIGGMPSLVSGRLIEKIGRSRVMFLGLGLAIMAPLLYGFASNYAVMALIYGMSGVSFWTIQTAGFVLAGDLIPKNRRGRLLSRYNTVIALSWGPAGLLIGGPLADVQVGCLGLSRQAAYVNAFGVSALIVVVGTILFALKVARAERKGSS